MHCAPVIFRLWPICMAVLFPTFKMFAD